MPCAAFSCRPLTGDGRPCEQGDDACQLASYQVTFCAAIRGQAAASQRLVIVTPDLRRKSTPEGLVEKISGVPSASVSRERLRSKYIGGLHAGRQGYGRAGEGTRGG
jgi:hypothetical protein